jgi:CHAD domain-containing protein
MLRHLQSLRSEVEGVRLAEDIECIHRMRVASRRLRAAQQLFDGCIPEKKAMTVIQVPFDSPRKLTKSTRASKRISTNAT